jgi:hypothetical protein
MADLVHDVEMEEQLEKEETAKALMSGWTASTHRVMLRQRNEKGQRKPQWKSKEGSG